MTLTGDCTPSWAGEALLEGVVGLTGVAGWVGAGGLGEVAALARVCGLEGLEVLAVIANFAGPVSSSAGYSAASTSEGTAGLGVASLTGMACLTGVADFEAFPAFALSAAAAASEMEWTTSNGLTVPGPVRKSFQQEASAGPGCPGKDAMMHDEPREVEQADSVISTSQAAPAVIFRGIAFPAGWPGSFRQLEKTCRQTALGIISVKLLELVTTPAS
jgi:hypothetical protein